MHTRIAAMSPSFAMSIALRAIASASPSSRFCMSGRLVARSARPAGRIAALAFLKLHDLISFHCDGQKPPRARRACARVLTNTVRECGDEKSPQRLARASDAVLVNNGFLEDSVTRSQAFCCSRARKMRSPCKQQEKNRERGPQAICVRSGEPGRVLINASAGRVSAFGGERDTPGWRE